MALVVSLTRLGSISSEKYRAQKRLNCNVWKYIHTLQAVVLRQHLLQPQPSTSGQILLLPQTRRVRMNTVKSGVLKEAASQLAWHSLKRNPVSFTRQFVRSNTAVVLSFWTTQGHVCLFVRGRFWEPHRYVFRSHLFTQQSRNKCVKIMLIFMQSFSNYLIHASAVRASPPRCTLLEFIESTWMWILSTLMWRVLLPWNGPMRSRTVTVHVCLHPA